MSSLEHNPILQRAIISAKARKLSDETLPSIQKTSRMALVIGLTFGLMGVSVTASHHISPLINHAQNSIKIDPLPKRGSYLSCGPTEGITSETPLCGTRLMKEFPIPDMSEDTIKQSPTFLQDDSDSGAFNGVPNHQNNNKEAAYPYASIAPFPEKVMASLSRQPSLTDAQLIQFLRHIGNRISYFPDPSASDEAKDAIIVSDVLTQSEKNFNNNTKNNQTGEYQSFIKAGDSKQTVAHKLKLATLIFDKTAWESSRGYTISSHNLPENSEKLLGDIYKANGFNDNYITKADIDDITRYGLYPKLREKSPSLESQLENFSNGKTISTIKQQLNLNKSIDCNKQKTQECVAQPPPRHEIEYLLYIVFAGLFSTALYLKTNALMIKRTITNALKS